MRHYYDSVLQVRSGLTIPAPGVSITVNLQGTQTAATVYSDDGITTKLNPLATDANGRFDFYIANGRYDLIFAGTGFANFTQFNVEITDAMDTTVLGKTVIAFTANNTHSGAETFTGPVTFTGLVTGTGLTNVSSLAATCTPGVTSPVQLAFPPGGVFYCIALNTWAPDNPGTTVSPLAFGGKFDVKFVYDASFTLNSPTVTCPQNDCSFQCPGGVYPCTVATTGCTTPSSTCDVGKIVFGTNDANIGSAVGTGLLTAQNTITQVNSASSITMSGNASSTCTASGTVLCNLAWGSQDDTTAINNAMTFAWGTSGSCKALQFPSGNYFFSAPILSMSITQLSQACGGSQGAVAGSGVDTTQVGPEAFGQGPGNTVGIPLPNFNYASCVSNGNICIGNTGNLELHDMGWNGLGQLLASRSDTNMAFLQLGGSTGGGSCTGSTGFNLALAGWGYSDTGTFGASLGVNACGDPLYSNIVVERTGSTTCFFQSSLVADFSAIACLGAPTRVLQLTCPSNQIINTYGCEFVDLNVGGPTISQNGCYWNSNGDWINATAASTTLYQNVSGVVSTANFTGTTFDGRTTASQIFLGQASANNSIHLKNSTVRMAASTKLFNNNASTLFFDDGGNDYGAAGAASTISGPLIADGHSVKGTCTGVATASQTLGLFGTGPNVTLTTCTSTVIGSGLVIQGPRTLQHLVVTSTAAGVNASSGAVTVLKNGVATTITCTIGTGTSCNDTTHYVAAADGDLISIQFTTQAAETLAGVKAIVEWN